MKVIEYLDNLVKLIDESKNIYEKDDDGSYILFKWKDIYESEFYAISKLIKDRLLYTEIETDY